MLETLIIATLALGLLSLVAWLALGDRPADRRPERPPVVSGRVVGAIGAASTVTASRASGPGRGDGEMTAVPVPGDNPELTGAEVREPPMAAGGH